MQDRLFIDGDLVPGNGSPAEIVDPSSGLVAALVGTATPEQVDDAAAAAARAWPAWRDAPQEDRSTRLHAIAGVLEERRGDLADVLTLDTGRPRTRNLLYVDFAASVLRQYAELARMDAGRLIPANDPGGLAMVARVPYGVVACLVPWNYPLDLLVFKVAPALAVGNTVVAKGAEETTLSTLALADVFAPHLPAGVVNLVAGGRGVGEALVEHPGVDMVAFTGSTAAGRAIGARCAELTKPAHLELGGKDPAIVFPDAGVDVAARGVVWASMLNAGQVCTSTERCYVDAPRYDEFVEAAAAITDRLVLGDPAEATTQVGPMRSAAGRARVERHLADATGKGAKVVVGGSPIDRDGFFFQPTVVRDVDHTMLLMREETFGPVLPIMPYDDIDEAFRLAADTPYGLGASIYTRDASLVERAMRELRVGGLWVNDAVVDNRAGPLAGSRASGNGRELGVEGLHAFTQVRHVQWSTRLEPKPWWY
jgi:acyl-CoA reductase-like NAD-dependent aldehyde dehydrogenase